MNFNIYYIVKVFLIILWDKYYYNYLIKDEIGLEIKLIVLGYKVSKW